VIAPMETQRVKSGRVEGGVDIFDSGTLAGHKDGGVLALKTYGHLRSEHSTAMAAKVMF
jgi:hypothetical protein